MKKYIALLLCAGTFLASCKKETIRGGGAVITETRTVPAFTGVELGGDGDVTIAYGTASQVTLNGYANLLPIYETEVRASVLYLKFKSDIYNVKNNNIKVNITIPGLSLMRINGSGKMQASNFTDAGINASINGSGYLFIGNSQFNTATYMINGSGEIDAASTLSNEATANISGSGNIELKVRDNLKATISGSGNIDYWGTPTVLETSISGSGKITKR